MDYHKSFEMAREIQNFPTPDMKVVFADSSQDSVSKENFYQIYKNMRNNLTEVDIQLVEDIELKSISDKSIQTCSDKMDFTHLFLSAPR